MTCADYPGSAWGYNFDWEARAFYVPQGKPNIVTTVFVANAFLDHYAQTKDEDSLQLADGACQFVLQSLILHEDENNLCFGYIPGEEARVHNANMLGAALLGRVYALTGNPEYLQKSRKAMAYSVAAMQDDHSWPYGERSHHRFVDNFHTGFNLVALKEWMDSTGELQWQTQLEAAYSYFLDTFWLEGGCPKYYNDSLYPIDIHCSAQGIVTCLKLQALDPRSLPQAEKIATWAIDNMQHKQKGYFFYQKTRFYTNKIPYIRWSQAWMFYALAMLLKEPALELTRGEEKMSRIEVMGCPVDALDMEQSIARIEDWVAEGIPRQHVVINVSKVVEMRTDTHLRNIIIGCDMINVDGMPIVWASKLLGTPLPCRVAGVDLFQILIKTCAEKGYRPFFFGATEEVVTKVVATFQALYPELSVAGYRNGYYAPEEEKSIAEMIHDSKADMMFVGFSSPKKEKFLNEWMPVMNVPFCMGVGGSIDIVAGKTRRAPKWMQESGLEWFYRILQEPRRMWKRYAKTNPVFIGMVIKELLMKMTRRDPMVDIYLF